MKKSIWFFCDIHIDLHSFKTNLRINRLNLTHAKYLTSKFIGTHHIWTSIILGLTHQIPMSSTRKNWLCHVIWRRYVFTVFTKPFSFHVLYFWFKSKRRQAFHWPKVQVSSIIENARIKYLTHQMILKMKIIFFFKFFMLNRADWQQNILLFVDLIKCASCRLHNQPIAIQKNSTSNLVYSVKSVRDWHIIMESSKSTTLDFQRFLIIMCTVWNSPDAW